MHPRENSDLEIDVTEVTGFASLPSEVQQTILSFRYFSHNQQPAEYAVALKELMAMRRVSRAYRDAIDAFLTAPPMVVHLAAHLPSDTANKYLNRYYAKTTAFRSIEAALHLDCGIPTSAPADKIKDLLQLADEITPSNVLCYALTTHDDYETIVTILQKKIVDFNQLKTLSPVDKNRIAAIRIIPHVMALLQDIDNSSRQLNKPLARMAAFALVGVSFNRHLPDTKAIDAFLITPAMVMHLTAHLPPGMASRYIHQYYANTDVFRSIEAALRLHCGFHTDAPADKIEALRQLANEITPLHVLCYVLASNDVDQTITAILERKIHDFEPLKTLSTDNEKFIATIESMRHTMALIREINADHSTPLDQRRPALVSLLISCNRLTFLRLPDQANLERIHLTGFDLPNIRLYQANLSHSNLSRSTLIGAYLRNANLVEAKLMEVNLASADLTNAHLSHAQLTIVNLEGAQLQGARLRGATLMNVTLEGANLKGVDLTSARFRATSLVGAQLEGANLRDVNLCDESLRRANLQNANLDCSDLRGANLDGTDLRGAKIHNTKLDNYALVGRDLHGTTIGDMSNLNVSRAILHGAMLKGRLDNAILIGADLTDADATQCHLEEADLSDTILTRANFKSAVLTNANLEGANLSQVNFINTFLRGVKWAEALGLESAQFINFAYLTKTNISERLTTLMGMLTEDLRELHAVYPKLCEKIAISFIAQVIYQINEHGMDIRHGIALLKLTQQHDLFKNPSQNASPSLPASRPSMARLFSSALAAAASPPALSSSESILGDSIRSLEAQATKKPGLSS